MAMRYNLQKCIISPDEKMSAFGPGPWVEESDLAEFSQLGMQCVVVRMAEIGHLCGYVRVPIGHAFHGMNYDVLNDYLDGVRSTVHGGITYARPQDPRTAQDDDEGCWWYGFDAAHAGDLVPKMAKYRQNSGDTYRDMAFMSDECVSLIKILNSRQSQ